MKKSRCAMFENHWFRLLFTAGILASTLVCSIPPPTLVTPSLEPPVPATDTPTPGWLPTGTIALYIAGPWDATRLHSLAADGSTTDLGRIVYRHSGMSYAGRWIASAGGPDPATTVTAVNLETAVTFITPLTTGFTLYGLAFDLIETRLAFMEMGQPAGGDFVWAIVVVNLADGSTTRFETTLTLGSHPDLLPGYPIGWSDSNDEFLLATFLPATEGTWQGVWGVAMPPGAASAALDSLSRREIVPAGSYLTSPRLSPVASQLVYLNRDFAYTPDDYVLMGYDLAVNQLWTVDLASAVPMSLVNVIDGGALMRDAAWSPDGTQVLFAKGVFAGGQTFTSLTLKVHESGGTVSDIGPAPLPAGGWMGGINWCTPEISLVTVSVAGGANELHMVDMTTGTSSLVASDVSVQILGCVP